MSPQVLQEVVESLDEKIDLLLTEDRDTYYQFVVAISERVEEIKSGQVEQNTEAKASGVVTDEQSISGSQNPVKQADTEVLDKNGNVIATIPATSEDGKVGTQTITNSDEGVNEVPKSNRFANRKIKNNEAVSDGKAKIERIGEETTTATDSVEQFEADVLDESGKVIGTSKVTIKDAENIGEPLKTNRFSDGTSTNNESKKTEGTSFGQDIKTNFAELVEEIVDYDYKGKFNEIKEKASEQKERIYAETKEGFEKRVDNIFDPNGYLNTVVKATVEMSAEEARLAIQDKTEQFKNLMDELVINDGKEFVGSLGDYKIENFGQKLGDRVKEIPGNIGNAAKDAAKGAVDKVAETAKNAGQAAKDAAKEAVDEFVDPFRIKPKRTGKGGSSDNDEEKKGEVFNYFIYLDNQYQGRYTLPKLENNRRYTVRRLVENAGYNTGVVKIKNNISMDSLARDGMIVWISTKSGDDNGDKVEKTDEEIFVMYEKKVKTAIREYISENDVKSVEALRKRVHYNSIIKRAEKKLEDENIDKKQIEKIVDRCIKEIEAGDKILNMSEDTRKKQLEEYRKSNDTKKLQEQLKVAEEQRKQQEAEEQVKNALAQLSDAKEEYVKAPRTNERDSTVNEARRLIMENDALNSQK